MIRNALAVVVGMIVGMVANMALIFLNLVFYPMPEGVEMADQEAMSAYFERLPATAFLLPIVAHLAQAFVGGLIAARMGASRPVMLAMIVGTLSMVGGIVNLMTPGIPTWMAVELPFYLVVAWQAGKMVERSRGDEAA